jgi:hypothetical protein
MEPYRRELLRTALYTFRDDGAPLYNLVLSGRAKKNWKTTDLVLSCFYRLLMWESPQGNDCFILANDEDQTGDDLKLAKRLLDANPATLGREANGLVKGIRRRDNGGSVYILPARDALGSHGKTGIFVGFDEVHGYRNWDIFEALAPDPTRTDALTWITRYDIIFNAPGVPLYDMKRVGRSGEDPRMLFSWYCPAKNAPTRPLLTFRLMSAPIPAWAHGLRVAAIWNSRGAACRTTSIAGCT